jgi:hypothetical protein
LDAPDPIYCTILDAGYLARGLALHASLVEANRRARFAFFCVDDLAARLLDRIGLERSIVLPPESYTTSELERLRVQRSRAEYCWTCKPFALLHLADAFPQARWLVYVDGDMMFFGDPDSALPGSPAHYLLTPHRFHPAFQQFEAAAGKHNAGYVAMRNSNQGRSAMRWWRERCIESCSARATDAAYADQKYLDKMLELFPFGESSHHPGLNAAPWNIERYRVSGSDAGVLLDDHPLLLYHFQALRLLNARLVDLYAGNRRIGDAARRLIYRPYLQRIANAYRELKASLPTDAPRVQSSLHFPHDWLRLGYELARGYHNLERFRLA